MGVDNNGILFLGRKEEELDLEKLESFDFEKYDDDGMDYLHSWSSIHGLSREDTLTAQDDNGYDSRFWLIGFKLGDSGSYDCKQIVDLAGNLERKTKLFVELFSVEPHVYIMNYQW
jgi:hypothetical protein